MASRWIDSIACYASVADFNTVYSNSGSGPSTYNTTGGRFGTGSIQISNTRDFIKSFPVGLASWAYGFAIDFVSLPGTAWAYLREGTTTHLDLRFDASGHVQVTRNGTALAGATGTKVILTGVSYVFQLKFTISDTVGTLEMYVDDDLQFSLTGLDTKNGLTGLVDQFRLGISSNAFVANVSEFYVNDTTGSAPNNGIWGSYRIVARRPSAAGNYAQWAPLSSTNVSNVDDTQGNDGDASYNNSFTAGQRDSFQFTPVTPASGTIPAIMHRIVARKDDAGVRTIAPFQRQSGADQDGTGQNVTLTYAHYTEIKETNPSTSAAFTLAEMKSSTPEFGYKLVA
jgi:hypothetical protein